jgi:pyridoxine 4-dehydrogenase
MVARSLLLLAGGMMPRASSSLQLADGTPSSSRRAFLSQSAAAAAVATTTPASSSAMPPANAAAAVVAVDDGAATTSPPFAPSPSSATDAAPSPPPGEGGSSLKLPPMGLGCWSWGDSLFWGYDPRNDGDLRAVFEYAASRRAPALFDSAELYGLGRSETLLGEYSRSLPSDPGDVVVATKFAALPWRTRPESVGGACVASAGRLGRPIDLYQIHFPNAYANEAYWDGLADVYERGLVRAVGVSNYGVDAVRACHAALARRGVPLSTNQVQYSLLYQHPEKSNGLLRCCEDLGMDVLAYSPLALGLLTGKYAGPGDARAVGGPRRTLFERNVAAPRYAEIVKAMGDVADGHADAGATIPQVAINWCIAKGTIPIPGARTLGQVKSNYGSLDWIMSEGEVEFLDKVSSGFSYIDPSASPFPRVDKDTGLVMFDS